MALPIALPWAGPAIGEGLLWGAGALGTGLAAAGIIDNKDAIREGISDFGNWIGDKVGSGIRAWSEAMSPKGPIGPSPHYDARTGRPVAVTDAIPAPRMFIDPSIRSRRVVVPTQYQTRFDSDGEPILFPWQSGSPERPIQLGPVIVTGSRVMRTDGGTDGDAAQSAQTEPTPTESEGVSPAPANPEPEGENNNSDDSNNRKRNFWWEGSGKPTSKFGQNFGRHFRNWGIRVPAYTAVGAPVIDVAGNIIGAGLEPDSVQHDWQWKITNLRFMPERTILRGIGKSYVTTPPPVAPQDTTTTKTTPATPTSQPGDTIPAVSGGQAASGDDDYQEWLNSQK